jgi:hypothetical protein
MKQLVLTITLIKWEFVQVIKNVIMNHLLNCVKTKGRSCGCPEQDQDGGYSNCDDRYLEFEH